MDKPGCQTNTGYLTDFIEITLVSKRIETARLVDLYVNKQLTSAQIAERIGCSKQMVLSRLRKAGVRNSPDKGRSPENYRFRDPPYGYRVTKEHLLLNHKEIKIAKLIVRLRVQEKCSWSQIAEELNRRGSKTRKQTPWGHFMVQIICNRWKDKV